MSRDGHFHSLQKSPPKPRIDALSKYRQVIGHLAYVHQGLCKNACSLSGRTVLERWFPRWSLNVKISYFWAKWLFGPKIAYYEVFGLFPKSLTQVVIYRWNQWFFSDFLRWQKFERVKKNFFRLLYLIEIAGATPKCHFFQKKFLSQSYIV